MSALSSLQSSSPSRHDEPESCPACGWYSVSMYPWYDGNGDCARCKLPALHLPALLEKLAHQHRVSAVLARRP